MPEDRVGAAAGEIRHSGNLPGGRRGGQVQAVDEPIVLDDPEQVLTGGIVVPHDVVQPIAAEGADPSHFPRSRRVGQARSVEERIALHVPDQVLPGIGIAPYQVPISVAEERPHDRRIINAIFYVLRTGIPWRDLPERYGPYTSAYNRFNRWSRRGGL